MDWFSGGGAGGQHRNKHQNSCRLTHIPTGITRKAETRSRENSYREALSALKGALDELRSSQEHNAVNASRRTQVGAGMRSDKRRTYRFQDNAVTDHVSGKTALCSDLMRGRFEEIWP